MFNVAIRSNFHPIIGRESETTILRYIGTSLLIEDCDTDN